MRVAVITPYYKEPTEVLRRCYDSVKAQTHAVTHFMLSDGYPNAEVDNWDVVHIKLPAHADSGDTPRAIGALSASAQGFDAISLLDADNWFDNDHIATLVDVQQQTGVQVVTCTRTLRREDESILGICVESDGQSFNDTNCYLITKTVFYIFSTWGFKDQRFGNLGDRIFWNNLVLGKFSRAHHTRPTVNYVTLYGNHYVARGESPPPNAKGILEMEPGQHRLLPYAAYLEVMAARGYTAQAQPVTDMHLVKT